MHRQNLLQMLINYNPLETREIIVKQRMLEFLALHRDCFETSCQAGHFTASCWLVNDKFEKALLTHHSKLGIWIQLGGHCDGQQDLLQVAIKEAMEESGLGAISAVSPEIFDIDIHTVPAFGHEPSHLHYDVRFLLQAEGPEEVIKGAESKELLWVTTDINSLPTREPSILRMFNKWILRKGAPLDS